MKIHIIGCSGSGKSYLANFLSNKYNIPHFDLDNIYWDNDSNTYGTRMEIEKRNAFLQDILEKENWIIEGVYYKWLETSFEEADIIYVLDMPKYLYKYRIIKRWIFRKLNIEKNKKETLKSIYDLLKWTDIFQSRNLKEIKCILKKYDNKTIWITNRKEISHIINLKSNGNIRGIEIEKQDIIV